MSQFATLIFMIVLSSLGGLTGYYIGHHVGMLEGFVNGAMTVLTANDDFLAYNSHLVKHMQKQDEDNDDDDDDYHNDYYECQ